MIKVFVINAKDLGYSSLKELTVVELEEKSIKQLNLHEFEAEVNLGIIDCGSQYIRIVTL